MTRRKMTLAALALLLTFVALPTSTQALEAIADDFMKKAVKAAKAGSENEASAWYRAASACYRFVVLPLRLAEVDYIHESGILESSSTVWPFRDTLREELETQEFFSVRKRLEQHYAEKADLALRRARMVEVELEVRPMGLVPLEPTRIREAVERVIDRVVRQGAYELLLYHRYPELQALGEKRASAKSLAEVRQAWRKTKNHAVLAEGFEQAKRLARESGLAYYEKALDSLKKSTDHEAVEYYQLKLATQRVQVVARAKSAARYYELAAESMDAEGEVVKAIVYREKARRVLDERPTDIEP